MPRRAPWAQTQRATDGARAACLDNLANMTGRDKEVVGGGGGATDVNRAIMKT